MNLVSVSTRRAIFGVILLVAVVAVLGYEGYALFTAEEGDTISEIVWSYSCEGSAFVPVVFGIVMGGLAAHFFWRGRCSRPHREP